MGLMQVGDRAEIVGASPGRGAPSRAEDLGLRAGREVEMLRNGPGAVLVKVDESRLAVDRAVAMQIKVRCA